MAHVPALHSFPTRRSSDLDDNRFVALQECCLLLAIKPPRVGKDGVRWKGPFYYGCGASIRLNLLAATGTPRLTASASASTLRSSIFSTTGHSSGSNAWRTYSARSLLSPFPSI